MLRSTKGAVGGQSASVFLAARSSMASAVFAARL